MASQVLPALLYDENEERQTKNMKHNVKILKYALSGLSQRLID